MSFGREDTMTDIERKPMSAIFKEMAQTMLRESNMAPSSEAVGAALLLTHVAWQRSNGDEVPETSYAPVLANLQMANHALWKELNSSNTADSIAKLMTYKKRHYPHDRRKVIVCGTVEHKVHVEWTD